jgi:NAD(P)-dependent dehydrogenase (short-subunit alcohol dehydrogenase family)
MTESRLVNDKVIIVTGAGKGIGAATARLLAREGARVILAGTTAPDLEAVAAEIGAAAQVCPTDVSRAEQAQALVDFTLKTFGRLDGAFNNAGIDGPLASTVDYPEEAFDRVIAVNLKGVWNCLRAQIPAMLAGGGGAIVNCASALAEVGQYNMSAYCAAKAGVLGLTRVAALEYGPRGIRVNTLSPGVTETPMMSTMMERTPGLRELLMQSEPIGRLADPADIAEAALWLLSDRSRYALGANFAVDGGYLAR